MAENEKTLATMDPAEGYEKPKTLRQLEGIVETNALKGAGFWRKAADALLTIKEQKLWKQAKDENGEGYASFVVYAEARFGFKKTYAYDLVKAATHKPEALTEGEAREAMKADREPRPLTREKALESMQTAWTKFEDRAGDLRDRLLDDEDFVGAYDACVGAMANVWRQFTADMMPIAGVSARREVPEGEEA